MLTTDFNISKSTGCISLSGALTIENAAELMHVMADALSKSDVLEINHEAAESFDLSYLQILLSLKRTADTRHKVFSFIGNHPAGFLSVVEHAGNLKSEWMSAGNYTANHEENLWQKK